MKLKITLKDPDGVYISLRDAARESVKSLDGLTKDEFVELIDSRQEAFQKQCEPWVKWGEYVTIEIDTDENTATVCKV